MIPAHERAAAPDRRPPLKLNYVHPPDRLTAEQQSANKGSNQRTSSYICNHAHAFSEAVTTRTPVGAA